MDLKYYPANLTFDKYDFREWYKALDDLTQIKRDEENIAAHHIIHCFKVLMKEKD